MKYEIMKMSTLQQIKLKSRCVHDLCFEQFVVSVLAWYQHEATYKNKSHELEWRVIDKDHPPNLFELFEYPSLEAETVINQFVLSEALFNHDENPQLDFSIAKENAIKTFNNAYPYIFESMSHDVQLILDVYNLFYFYKDDTESEGKFYNPFVKEIW